jgi:KDO2-lipid IV(A) lauroyltransferase
MAALFLSDALRKRVERSPTLQRARWRLEAGVLALFWWIAGRLPPARASAFGRSFLATLGPRLPKSRHVIRNLSLAFPEIDQGRRHDLLRAVWGHVGAVLAEYPHLGMLGRPDNLETVLPRDMEAYRTGQRRAVFVTAHLGNWELAVAPAADEGIPITVAYAPGTNPIIDRMLRRRREALGCRFVTSDDGARALLKDLAGGRFLGLVIDARDDDGAPLPFFGLDKLTTIAPARLALKFGYDLVPVRVERLEGARFRITAHPPIRPDPTLASAKAQALGMMTEVNRLFEQWIRERPEEWACIKRAFPKDVGSSVEVKEGDSPHDPRRAALDTG